MCFSHFTYKAPGGQSYSYFYSVAHLVLDGNAPLFVFSIMVSFFSPCIFYVNQTNQLKHDSLNTSQKLCLFLRNVLFLVARVGSITMALFIPVIRQGDIFSANEGIDASEFLGFFILDIDFKKNFSNALNSLSADIRTNFYLLLAFLILHSLLVVTHAISRSPKFGKSTMKERWLHILSTFWLPLPYLSHRGVDRGEEKQEFWFLVALHSSENLVFLFFSIGISLPKYPFGLLVIPISLVTVNILAVLLSIFYTTRMELFSWLPESPPNMPSFGPEVSINLTHLI